MNLDDYLMTQLSGEAGEISHVVGKSLQFGLDDIITYIDPETQRETVGLRHDGQPEARNNRERLVDELNDLIGAANALAERGLIPTDWQSIRKQEEKREKIYRYAQYAIKKKETNPIMNLIERLLRRFVPYREIINCDHDVYLVRWYLLRTKWLGIFVHKFVRSDEDRALHDHPWRFLIIPLWRGYIEHGEQPDGNGVWKLTRRVWPLLGTRLRPALFRHRVELIDGKPAWSLFFRFRKVREWGFWPKEGFIQWNRWWKENKCEDESNPTPKGPVQGD